MIPNRPDACPCGGASPATGGKATPPRYADCCGRFIDGGAPAPSALELMRSRYTAYVLGALDYLRATWDARTCPPDLDIDPDAPDAPRWLGLAIKRHATLDETHAEVEFVARYKVGRPRVPAARDEPLHARRTRFLALCRRRCKRALTNTCCVRRRVIPALHNLNLSG